MIWIEAKAFETKWDLLIRCEVAFWEKVSILLDKILKSNTKDQSKVIKLTIEGNHVIKIGSNNNKNLQIFLQVGVTGKAISNQTA